MKQVKYTRTAPVRRRRTKPTLLLACIALILCLSIGGTLAYIAANSGTVSNEFVPGQVSCQVIRSGNTISVKNTSNIPAYLRATYAVNWMDSSGNVSGTKPTQTVTIDNNWSQSGGFYYDGQIVASGASVTFIQNAPTGSIDGYTLAVEVVAEAIQAEGTLDSNDSVTAVLDAWGLTPGGN